LIIALLDWPFFLAQFLMVFSTINLVFLVANMPLSDKGENLVEIWNEFCIWLVSYTVSMFLNGALEVELRGQLGWFLMGVAFVNIAVNLGITTGHSLLDVRKNYVHNKAAEKRQLKLKEKLGSYKKLSEWTRTFDNPHSQLERIERELKVHEAVEYCREYITHRNWMKANKLPVKELE